MLVILTIKKAVIEPAAKQKTDSEALINHTAIAARATYKD